MAALSVVAFHALGMAAANGYSMPAPQGEWGVDIFFVVSGVVMALTTEPGDPVAPFMLRRFKRIAPLYWLATTAKIVLMLAVPALFILRLDPAHVLASYAFIPWPDQTGALHPVLYVGWTLSYEMAFYLAFALCGFRVEILALVALVAIAAGVDPVILEFVAGLAIGNAMKGCPAVIPAVVAACALALPDSRIFFWGVPAVVVVVAAIRLERLWPGGLLNRLGDSSFELYITHTLVLPVFFIVLRSLHVPGAIAVCTAIAAAVVVGLATHAVAARSVTIRQRARVCPVGQDSI